MATYLDLQQRIAQDLRRSNLGPEIAAAILDAIRDHDSERFYFNEAYVYLLTTIAGTDDYILAPQDPVDEFIRIDTVRAQIGNTWYTLIRETMDDMEILFSTPTSGQPYHWAFHDHAELRLFPTPNQPYPVKVFGHYRITALAAPTDSNEWTNAGKNLIRYSTLKRLFFYPIRDSAQAQIAEAGEMRELEYLRRETDRRARKGVMEAYY